MLTFPFLGFILTCEYPVISEFGELRNYKCGCVKVNCLTGFILGSFLGPLHGKNTQS